tara:strand:+ start:3127 stop:3504 length:378 start_codon:yes stop_codon:yes gene_type:complete
VNKDTPKARYIDREQKEFTRRLFFSIFEIVSSFTKSNFSLEDHDERTTKPTSMIPPNDPETAFMAGLTPIVFPAAATAAAPVVVVAEFSFADGINKSKEEEEEYDVDAGNEEDPTQAEDASSRRE